MVALAPTSRKAAPASAVLKRRRELAEQRLAIEKKLSPSYATIAELDEQLKKIATDGDASFKEDFGARGFVSVAAAVAAEFKGNVPVVQTEAWNALKKLDQQRLIKSGLIKVEKNFGRASNGRVTVKVL